MTRIDDLENLSSLHSSSVSRTAGSVGVEMTTRGDNRKYNLSACPGPGRAERSARRLSNAGDRAKLFAFERSLSNSGEYEILENH